MAEQTVSEASGQGSGLGQSQEAGTVRGDENVAAALPPLIEPQQAFQATQHARVLIQAQARAALLAQANVTSQSAQRLLS